MSRGLRILAAGVLAAVAVGGVLLFFQARDESTIGEDGGAAPGVEAPEAASRTLEQGNVVFQYADKADREPLERLATEIAGPPDEALRHAGQAIIVESGDGLGALAFRRRLEVSSPDDPALREFAEYWLGRSSLP